MDFIERWLHISPDSENGASELVILAIVIVTALGAVGIVLLRHFPRNFIEYVEQLGKRENSDRFDN